MTKSTITRERLEELAAGQSGFNLRIATPEESQELARIALAALCTEPVGEFYEDGPLNWYQISDGDRVPAHRRIPLYRHTQQPVVPDAIPVSRDIDAGYLSGWNDCRAAMLKDQPQNAPQNIPEIIPDCWCRTCRPVVLNDMRFVLCPDCGNKRCPRANDHRNSCTGSNEPGQEGSAYPAAPQSPGSEPATAPGKWIPVSEKSPELGDWLVTDGRDFDVQLFNGEQFIPGFVWEGKITHWMPLPAAPQGDK